MKLSKNSCRKIASVTFLASTLLSAYTYHLLNFPDLLTLTGGITTGIITAGIWLETSYRLLVKEATAPLDKLIEKL